MYAFSHNKSESSWSYGSWIYRHDITEILLKVALNTITFKPYKFSKLPTIFLNVIDIRISVLVFFINLCSIVIR